MSKVVLMAEQFTIDERTEYIVYYDDGSVQVFLEYPEWLATMLDNKSHEIDNEPQRAQSQLCLVDQLRSLRALANRWGYYDAADYIGRQLGDD